MAIVVNPNEFELNKRIFKKESSLQKALHPFPRLPLDSLKEIKFNFVLPSVVEGFDLVHFIELEED